MPRSQNIKFGLLFDKTYSPASSHSSMRIERPRLSRTGLPVFAAAMSNWKVLGVARADLENIAIFGDEFGVGFRKQFGNHVQPSFTTGFGQKFQPLFAEALEFVGRSARLESAAAQDRRAGFRHGMSGGHQLNFIFNRARPGHDLKFFAADDLFTNFDGGSDFVSFAADEFVFLLHGHDALDLRPRAEDFEGCVRAFVADRADDRAFDAAHDVRAVAELFDLLKDFVLVFFRDIRLQDNNHNSR